MRGHYSAVEEGALRAALRGGGRPTCPRCDVRLAEQPVPPRSDVAYVRDRLWLVCPRCRRSLVVERREAEGLR